MRGRRFGCPDLQCREFPGFAPSGRTGGWPTRRGARKSWKHAGVCIVDDAPTGTW
jgi:hypothetical protein